MRLDLGKFEGNREVGFHLCRSAKHAGYKRAVLNSVAALHRAGHPACGRLHRTAAGKGTCAVAPGPTNGLPMRAGLAGEHSRVPRLTGTARRATCTVRVASSVCGDAQGTSGA